MDSVFCIPFICCYKKIISPHCSTKAYGSCQNNIIHFHFCYLSFSLTKTKLNTKKGKDHLLFTAYLFHGSVVWFLCSSHRCKAPSPPLQFPHMQKRQKTKPKMKLQNQGSSSNFLQFQNSVEGVTSICTCWKIARSIPTMKIIPFGKQGRH